MARGGARPGAGRKAGIPNKSNQDVKALIQANVDMVQIIKGLAQIAVQGDSDAARVAASRELLDRAFGKATQPIAGDDSMAAIRTALTVAFVGPKADG